jgi:sulfane dehydrogenase subunit SoxC
MSADIPEQGLVRRRLSRRTVLAGAVGLAGAAATGKVALAQQTFDSPAELPDPSLDPTTVQGMGSSAYGFRSPFEEHVQRSGQLRRTSSLTPHDQLEGIITPNALHFERHHAGVPNIDPARYRLVIHGAVGRSMVYTLDELKRFPSVSRILFLECSGNGSSGYMGTTEAGTVRDATAQSIDGLTSTAEWTGVKLSTLLDQVKPTNEGRWMLAESMDAARMTRSVPIEKAWDDAIIAYAQNGEAIYPAHGYPVRLILPGWEGNINAKWLRRLELGPEPFMTREETSKYTDPVGDEPVARMFTWDMDAKSMITYPTGAHQLSGPGFYEVHGLAWSGRGMITRVEISPDGGTTWYEAQLQEPVLSKAHTRFRFPWTWNGQPAVLQSRATDETGYVQPTREAYIAVRGTRTSYHYNNIRSWQVNADGTIKQILA